jgi:hypothetical protein
VDTVSQACLAISQQFLKVLFPALYIPADQVVHKEHLVQVQQQAYQLSGELKHLLSVSTFF